MLNISYLQRILIALLGIGAFVAPMQAQSVATPPFLYTGRILDYLGAGLDVAAGGSAVIYAYKGSTLLAQSNIVTAEGSVNNFCLYIPTSTSSDVEETAQVGDSLTFVVDDGTSTYTVDSTKFATVGNPGRSVSITFVAALDENGNGVADEYEEAITLLVSADSPYYGLAYDPDGDWDGDGVSNYDEYLAGTDPLSSSDSLSILALNAVSENEEVLAAEFLPSQGRAYGVIAADTLEEITSAPESNTPFQKEKAQGASKVTTYNESDGGEIRTLYLIKRGASGFYRLYLQNGQEE